MHTQNDIESRRQPAPRGTGISRISRLLFVALEWAIVGIIVIALLVTYLSILHVAETPALETVEVLIASGDTLWSLAQANPLPGMTTADTVSIIRDLNHIDSYIIETGSMVRIPVSNERALRIAAQ